MKKLKINDFIIGYTSYYFSYVNLNTLEVIDDYDYSKLSTEEKEFCELIPMYSKNDSLRVAKRFFKQNPKLKEKIQWSYNTSLLDMNMVFDWLEYYDIEGTYGEVMVQFREFEYQEQKKFAIEWCKKRNIEYSYESRMQISDEEFGNFYKKTIDDWVDSYDNHKDRYDYFESKDFKYKERKQQLWNTSDKVDFSKDE